MSGIVRVIFIIGAIITFAGGVLQFFVNIKTLKNERQKEMLNQVTAFKEDTNDTI